MDYSSESFKRAKIEHDYSKDSERWEQERKDQEDAKRRDKAQSGRYERASEGNKREREKNIKDSFKKAINDSQSTKEKRQLKKERDAYIRELEKPEIPAAAPQDNSPKDPFYDPQGSSGNTQGDGQAPTTESTSSVLYETSNSDEASVPIVSETNNGSPGGGGVPSGFAEETLDVVNANNTAGQRVFLTKAV